MVLCSFNDNFEYIRLDIKNWTRLEKQHLLKNNATLIIIGIFAVHQEPAYHLTLDNLLFVIQFEAAIFLKHLK